MAKLNYNDKFFIIDDDNDGDLILVDEIEIDLNMIKTNYVILRGTRFFVDYDENNIDKDKRRVELLVSFTVEDINEVE